MLYIRVYLLSLFSAGGVMFFQGPALYHPAASEFTRECGAVVVAIFHLIATIVRKAISLNERLP